MFLRLRARSQRSSAAHEKTKPPKQNRNSANRSGRSRPVIRRHGANSITAGPAP